MAETQLWTSSQKQVWINDYLLEYVRTSGFAPYMSSKSNAIFRMRNELQNQGGKTINVPLITRLKGTGVTGSQVLEGNEEDLGNYNAQVSIDWLRNAVVLPKSTTFMTEMDLASAARDQLVTWSAEKLRDSLIQALGQIVVPGATGVYDTYVNYGLATAGQKNTYGVNNRDRVLFGSLESNYSATWATALGNVDATNDRLSTTVLSLAKYMAKLAGNRTFSTAPGIHIRPYSVPEYGREYFVLFCHPGAFLALKSDTAMVNANRDARAREGSAMDRNPLFQDGDLIYDGVICREIPELDQLTISGVGASNIDVAQNFLCGQSAVGIAWGQQPTPRTNLIRDYGFRPGFAIDELRGQNKMSYLGVQYGMVSVFTATT